MERSIQNNGLSLSKLWLESKAVLRVVPDPKPTTINDIADSELSALDMKPVKHRDFNVTLFAYNDDDLISTELLETGTWDGEDVKRICHEFVKNGGKGNVLDVGTNIGAYTVPLASCLKEHGNGNNLVIGIEGAPWNARHVRAAMKYNNLDNVRLYQYLVGAPNDADMVGMNDWPSNQGMSHVNSVQHQVEGIEQTMTNVKATTIDAIARNEGTALKNIFAMKIDIEGYELKAFEGATEFFKNGPCVVWMELKDDQEGLTNAMQGHGYVVHPTNDHDDNAWCERKDMQECIAHLK